MKSRGSEANHHSLIHSSCKKIWSVNSSWSQLIWFGLSFDLGERNNCHVFPKGGGGTQRESKLKPFPNTNWFLSWTRTIDRVMRCKERQRNVACRVIRKTRSSVLKTFPCQKAQSFTSSTDTPICLDLMSELLFPENQSPIRFENSFGLWYKLLFDTTGTMCTWYDHYHMKLIPTKTNV